MSDRPSARGTELVIRPGQRLIAVPFEEDGEVLDRYFVEDPDSNGSDDDIEEALSLCGVWSDLDWDDMERALDRIRHESPPTPPITDL